MTENSRQAVLVLGMHRSGTSALTGVCHLLGAATPTNLLPSAADNPTGFWESKMITAANDAILSVCGYTWYDCLPFTPTSADAELYDAVLTECAPILTSEFANAPFFALKDPRFSLLLNLWLPVFAHLDVSIAPLLTLRHPAEATASLHRRDRLPREIIASLWLHYMLEAEHQTRGRPRAVLSYDRFLDDWRGCLTRVTSDIGIKWSVPLDSAAESIDGFLRPQMRHHRTSPDEAICGKSPLSAWIAETYDALRHIENGGEEPYCTRLDHVREEFAVWRRASAPRIALCPNTLGPRDTVGTAYD